VTVTVWVVKPDVVRSGAKKRFQKPLPDSLMIAPIKMHLILTPPALRASPMAGTQGWRTQSFNPTTQAIETDCRCWQRIFGRHRAVGVLAHTARARRLGTAQLQV